MVRATVRTRVHSFAAAGEVRARADVLAGEEPLEIRLDGEEFAVAMRTPGADVDLVFGLLLAEGVIVAAADIREIDFSTGLVPDGSRDLNVARVRLAPEAGLRAAARTGRNVYTSSACGICGTNAIEGVAKASAHPVPAARPLLAPARILELPELLRAQQPTFERTGGIHGAGLFRCPDPTGAPELLAAAEDVGRHNAVDKALGRALREGLLPLGDCVLQVSSRASYELVQKASMAGVPVLSAVSAPSSAAVELGRQLGLTVIGFNRGRTFNAYTGLERIAAGPA